MAVGTAESIALTVAGRRVSLHLCQLGLACCGLEIRAAMRLPDLSGAIAAGVSGSPGGDGPAPAEADLNVLVVAGTITLATADAVREAYEALPEPRAVLAFGACAISGGPYWDSYAIVPGAHRLVPVDVVLPGCPPRPEELLGGLAMLVRHE